MVLIDDQRHERNTAGQIAKQCGIMEITIGMNLNALRYAARHSYNNGWRWRYIRLQLWLIRALCVKIRGLCRKIEEAE